MDESMLSPELMREFGGNVSDLVLPSRSKQKRERVPVQSEEEKEAEQKLSKRAKKKIEQLQAKKEKEAKRAHYYEVLEKNALAENHSSRDASNVRSQSTKSKVKRAFHMHKAGIPLSTAEKNLLFSERRNSDIEEGSSKYSDIFQSSNKEEIQQSMADTPKPNGDGSDSYSNGEKSLSVQVPEIATHPDVKSTVAFPALTTNPVPAASLGLSLLQQIQMMKQEHLVSKAQSDDDSESDDQEDTQTLPVEKAYVPVEMDLPVDNFGNVKRGAGEGKESGPISSKLRFIVERDPEIQACRMKLPVCAMEQEIVEEISMHDVVILCGETGSGKSTQVPQFMYEAGYAAHGIIGVTQPRRVAAVSTSRRVAEEMGVCWKSESGSKHIKASSSQSMEEDGNSRGELVGYQIRHDSSTVGDNTKIKFMTDGILLKEISSDLMLRNYSVVFLDEAHERNVNTDVLIGMISRTIPMRRKQHELELAQWLSIPAEERGQYEPPIQPLKLVIMSATMRVNDFKNPRLFIRPPPVIKVEARQFPVVSHFARRTEIDDYLHETFRKVCQIHRKLPSGGILVFLTGKREIAHMCRKLTKRLNSKVEMSDFEDVDLDENMPLGTVTAAGSNKTSTIGLDDRENEADMWMDSSEQERMSKFIQEDDFENSDDDEEEELGVDLLAEMQATEKTASLITVDSGSEEIVEAAPESAEDRERKALLREALGADAVDVTMKKHASNGDDLVNKSAGEDKNEGIEESVSAQPTRVLVLPLYAMLSAEQQRRVFEPPPEGHRLIVVATNVAETSITIPGIRYVVDCGRQKERIVDLQSGISTYKVKWISKASADQRQGRAGRTGPGHCYRLYSSAFYDQHMAAFHEPEICSVPLEDLILQLRSLGIDNVDNFPFPSPPPSASLRKAYLVLSYIGALRPLSKDNKKMSALESIDAILKPHTQHSETQIGGLTALGKTISKFPINVRLAKMLIVAYKTGSLPISLVTAMVACVSARSPFVRMDHSQKEGEGDEGGGSDQDDEDADNVETDSKMEMWQHSTSDILARLRALGAFAYAKKQDDNKAKIREKLTKQSAKKNMKNKKIKDKDKDKANVGEEAEEETTEEESKSAAAALCSKLGLQYTTLSRCLELQQQLCSLCVAILAKKKNGASTSGSMVEGLDDIPPPDAAQEIALRKVMLTGLSDCIARKAPLGSLEITPGMSRRKRLTAYLSCDPSITTPLYIHPNSALFRKDPTAPLPEFIIYGELVTNEKEDTTYMSSLSAISGSWIPQLCKDSPLLKYSPFLSDPQPYFDPVEDAVMCFVPVTYGIHKWDIGPVAQRMSTAIELMAADKTYSSSEGLVGYTKQDEDYRWFARLLLEGKVVPDKSLSKVFKKIKMAEAPAAITALKPSKKVAAILDRLVRDQVCSLRQLHLRLRTDSLYLSAEIQPFLKTEFRKEFRLRWKEYTAHLGAI